MSNSAAWENKIFSDLLAEPVRNGIYKKKEFHGRGAKIVNMGELFENPRLRDIPMRRVEISESEGARFLLSDGDLIFARRSLTAEGAGKCSIVLEASEPTTFESSIIRARPSKSKANSLYLYYFFNSPVGLYLLETIRRQVAVAGITGSDLAKLKIPTPPLRDQHVIAAILGTLDDRIDNLRQTNATLEAMAQALFKSWFVDFDGVPPEDMQASELGLIPKGWQVEEIGKLVQCVGGATPSTKDKSFWNNGIHHWATPKDLSKLQAPVLITTERRITDAGVARISSGLLPAGTLLLSSRAPVGYLAISAVPVAINQGFIAMLPKGALSPTWLLFWAKANMDVIKQNANGSTFMEISKTAFRSIKVTKPPPDDLAKFNAMAGPMLERIMNNERHIATLIQLRDTLLPQLISGKLRPSQASVKAIP